MAHDPDVIELLIQRNAGDCGVCCLSSILQVPYVKVSMAALKLSKSALSTGLFTHQMMEIAEKLGKPLKLLKPKQIDLDDRPTGILIVRQKRGSKHAVVLFDGVIHNPADGLTYTLDAFLSHQKAKVLGLLIL